MIFIDIRLIIKDNFFQILDIRIFFFICNLFFLFQFLKGNIFFFSQINRYKEQYFHF